MHVFFCMRERERKTESGTQKKIVAFNQYLLDVCACFVSSTTIDDDDFQIALHNKRRRLVLFSFMG